MNYKLISKILGYILLIETAFMAPSLILSLVEKDGSASGFYIPMVLAVFLGLILINLKVEKKIPITKRWNFNSNSIMDISFLSWSTSTFYSG